MVTLPRPAQLTRHALRATHVRRADVLLELDLSRGVLDQPPSDPFTALRARHRPTLRGVVEGLERAARDPRVTGLLVQTGQWQPSLAQSAELRAGIHAVRRAGKRTVAWSASYGEMGPGNTAYHLASACEEVWLQPSGDVGLVGLSARAVFVREALDKLGVEPQLGQRREYKSAAETFTRNHMSDANRVMLTRLVESATATLVADIAASRGLDPAEVEAALQRGPLSAEEATGAGLVDRLGYRDEVYAAVRPDPEVELCYVERYAKPRPRVDAVVDRRPVIAVVDVAGPIHLGRSGGRSPLGGPSVGAESVGAALRAAGRDEAVRAVVLRVDSPGGSYVASDSIRREILALRSAGTSVVASMGSVAASGGYYVAMPCEVVLASPGTLTGSIGVLAGKQVLREGLRRLGVNRESVSTGRYAEMFSPDRGFDEEEWTRLEAWLDRVYDDFTTKAAADRGLPLEDLRAVARGRVWTGADAVERGLVDELGGLSRAVDVACQRVGVRRGQVAIRTYPRTSPLHQLLPAQNSEAPAAQAPSMIEGGTLLAHVLAGLGLPAYGVLTMNPQLRLT